MNGIEGRSQGLVWLLIAMAVALLAALAPSSAQAADEGQELYIKNGCVKCHAIAALKIEVVEDEDEDEEEEEDPFAEEGDEEEPADLSGIGASWEHGEDGMAKWLTKKLEIEDKLHKKKFPGSKKELKSLSAWLMTLTKPAAAE